MKAVKLKLVYQRSRSSPRSRPGAQTRRAEAPTLYTRSALPHRTITESRNAAERKLP